MLTMTARRATRRVDAVLVLAQKGEDHFTEEEEPVLVAMTARRTTRRVVAWLD